MTIGERVHVLLRRGGVGFREFDRQLGVASGWTSRLVSGAKQHPRPDALVRIADAFGVHLDWLIAGRGPVYRSTEHLRLVVGMSRDELHRAAMERRARRLARRRRRGQAR